MNRSVLIMGCSDSRHVYNFINIVLSDPLKFDHITIFNVAYVDHEPKEFDDYYLIITDDFKSVKDLSIINRIINSETNVGFSLLVFSLY